MDSWVSSFTLNIILINRYNRGYLLDSFTFFAQTKSITNSCFSSLINKSDGTSISSSESRFANITYISPRGSAILFVLKVCEEKNCKFLKNIIQRFNWLNLNITTLIAMWLVATVINFLIKISLENYVTTLLEQ